MVDQDSQASDGDHQEFSSEGIVVGVIGRTELEEDEVAGGNDGQDEDDLHDTVVDGDEVGG